MKLQFHSILTILFFGIFFLADAQNSLYEKKPGQVTFGLNTGLAYQQGDVDARLNGFGVGMTVAHSFVHDVSTDVAVLPTDPSPARPRPAARRGRVGSTSARRAWRA